MTAGPGPVPPAAGPPPHVIPVPAWAPPWATTGNLNYERVSTSPLGSDPAWLCLEHVAKGARPQVWPPYTDLPSPVYGTFWLGLARDAIWAVLGTFTTVPDVDQVDPTAVDAAVDAAADAAKGAYPPIARYVAAQAARGYLTVLDRLRRDEGWGDVVLVPEFVATDTHPGPPATVTTDWVTWGVHLTRDGGRVRETHLLRYRAAGARPIPAARAAAAGYALAAGYAADPNHSWSAPHRRDTRQPPTPQRVLVREVGVLDATVHTTLDATVTQALAVHALHGPAAVTILAGGSTRPGGRCADCRLRPHCPDGPRATPGLLGVAVRAPATLAVSPTDLGNHAACPHRVWLQRDLGLPSTPTGSGAAARGQRVHTWLEAAHGRGIACTAEDLPVDDLPDLADALGWTYDEYRAVRGWLAQHIPLCPLTDPAHTGHDTEVDVSVWDTDADVIFSTRIDHTCVAAGTGRVLREVKTVGHGPTLHTPEDLIDAYPQVAAAVVMLTAGYDPVTGTRFDPATVGPGRVEVEILTDTTGTVERLDPADPDTAISARVALASLLDDRITDTSHTPYPGPGCGWCPMRDWCPEHTPAVATALQVTPTPPGDAPPPRRAASTLDLLTRFDADHDDGDTGDDIPF